MFYRYTTLYVKLPDVRDKRRTLMNLSNMFKPKTMAVVGVSTSNDDHPANTIYYKNHLRQSVKVYGVNNRGGKIRGETLCQSIKDIPEPLDLVVIVTKAEFVSGIMEECIRVHAKGAVVISGGFAEVGRKDLQDKLISMAKEADFPFFGPNCLGIYSPPHIDTLFVLSERIVRPDPGRVAFISQSGGILVDQMVKFAGQGVGLSAGISIGNKALIRETDLLKYFMDDPDTDVIAFYMEGFEENEGRRFVLAAKNCTKPVIVLKSGKTPSGIKAVSSHTASIAGDYKVFSSVMAQYGIVEAEDDYELSTFSNALSFYPKPSGPNIGIVTGSGGHGALASDTCSAQGLTVSTLTSQDQTALKEVLSPAIKEIASYANPIDLTGSAVDDDFVEVVRYLSRKKEIDCILMLALPYSPAITLDLGARIGVVYQQEGKPIIAYVPRVEKYRILIDGFTMNNVPVAHSVEDAVKMARAIRRNKTC